MQRGCFRARFAPVSALVAVVVAAGLSGCSDRARLTLPNNGGPSSGGPTTTIDTPTGDTTVTAGPDFLVTGRTGDLDGVAYVYFVTLGGVSAFPPYQGSSDTVRFGLPLTTNGLSGAMITVRVYGIDRLGNYGDTATRRISIQ
jgi:hypothetical protein